jgi:hypothetical protein
MKTIQMVFASLMFFGVNCFSQTPPDDKNWEIVNAYDFTTMSAAAFNSDWISDLCIKSRQQVSLVEPQFYTPANISLTFIIELMDDC